MARTLIESWFERPEPRATNGTGTLLGAATLVDITPTMKVARAAGIAGFSRIATGATLSKVVGRLYATVLLVQGAEGERVALVGVDLHSGTRYLTERAALYSFDEDDGARMTADRIVLFATHTHTATGGMFGVRAYDTWCSSEKGFLQREADRVAKLIAGGLAACAASLEPVRVSVAQVEVHGLWANRSRKAFDANEDVEQATGRTYAQRVRAWHDGVPGLQPDHTRTDPRVRVLRMHGADDQLLGALAFVPAHPTSISPRAGVVSCDTFGFAAAAVENGLQRPDKPVLRASNTRKRPVAFVMAHAADANIEHPDVAALMDLPGAPADRGAALGQLAEQRGLELSRSIGEILAERTFAAFVSDAPLAVASGAARVRCRFDESLGSFATRKAILGHVSRGASEFGRYFFEKLANDGQAEFFGEWVAHKSPAEGTKSHTPNTGSDHHPKKVAVLKNGGFPEEAPHRVVDLGSAIRIGASSFEVSTVLGVRVIDALEKSAKVKVALFGTVAGSYTSYASTQPEYDEQHYEGASNLWGRGTGLWLIERMAKLASLPGSTPAPRGVFDFDD